MTVSCGLAVSASLNAWKPSCDREPDVDRLVAVAAPIGRLQHLGVAPDLGLGRAAAARRRCRPPASCSGPTSSPTRGQAGELPRRGAPDDDLVGARLEHPAFDDLDLGPHLERRARHAAQRHVGVARVLLGGWSTMTNSSGDASGPRCVARDARRVLDEPRACRRSGRSSSRCRCRRASRSPCLRIADAGHRRRKPSAIDSTPTNTITTPAMPTIGDRRRAEPLRGSSGG